jgi:hypothetical protein
MAGSIDFCAFPHFDSPAIFAALLDYDKSGRFQSVSIGISRTKGYGKPAVGCTRFSIPV